MSRTTKVVYVTSSEHKRRENEIFVANCKVDGALVRELFTFDIRSVQIKEILEVDIALMVRQEVIQAYKQIKEPCIVEHAGLIFDGYSSYPGGLTKPMWNVLGTNFISETQASGRRARARAVVAYCDGQKVMTFVGETEGTISDRPRGTRQFYWDTIFIPDNTDSKVKGKTYAEIVDDASLGLEYKVVHLSQSTRAMLQYLSYRKDNTPPLWPRM
jgi:inosine/xanthosine triphosphate pyrophosphatase family protein